MALLLVCAMGLCVAGAILGNGWVLFVLRLPIWKRKATLSCQQDPVAGHTQGCVSPGWVRSRGHHVPAAVAESTSHRRWCLGVSLYPNSHGVSLQVALVRFPFCGGFSRAEGFGHP